MASLTNYVRDRIERAVIEHAFTARADELRQRGEELFKALYERLYTKEQIAAIDSFVAAFPEVSALPTDYDIRDNAAGLTFDVGHRFFGNIQSPKTYLQLPFAYNGERKVTMEADDALCVQCQAWAMDCDTLVKEISERSKVVSSALYSFNTDKQLREGWPEIMSIADQFLPEKKEAVPLPATLRADLNAALGLPPMQEAA